MLINASLSVESTKNTTLTIWKTALKSKFFFEQKAKKVSKKKVFFNKRSKLRSFFLLHRAEEAGLQA